MAKVKVCLDAVCSKYYELDDGRAIHVPKDKCEVGKLTKNPKSLDDFKSRVNTMLRGVKKVVFMSDDPKWKEGDDALV